MSSSKHSERIGAQTVRVQHGGLSINIPAHWSDRSTLLFVGPSPLAADLPTTTTVDSGNEAVAISFVDGSQSHDEILATQAGPLAAAADGFEIVAESEIKSGLGTGRLQEQRMQIGNEPLRQLVGVFTVGTVGIVATATTGEAGFASAKARLLNVLESLAQSHAGDEPLASARQEP